MVRWLKNRFKKPTPVEIEQSLLTRLDTLVSSLQGNYRDFRISRSSQYWAVEVPIDIYQGYKTEADTLNEAVSRMIHVIEELLKDREKRMN